MWRRAATRTSSGFAKLIQTTGFQVPADEVLFLPSLPVRVDGVTARPGDVYTAEGITISSFTLAIDSALSLTDATLVRVGLPVTIEEPDLGITVQGTVTQVADRPGTNGADAQHVYLAVTPAEAPDQLVGASVKLTIAVESTADDALAVPVSALSVTAGGDTRVQVLDGNETRFVTVRPGLAANGLVEVTAERGSLKVTDEVIVGDRAVTARVRQRQRPGGEVLPDTPVLELRSVSRRFPTQPPVDAVRDVDLTIDRGEALAVVGPSGSGKSTLLNIIGLLDRPTAGTYLFEGNDTAALSEPARAVLRGRRIGFVFQSFHLLAYRSAVENVMLAEVYIRAGRAGRRERAAKHCREWASNNEPPSCRHVCREVSDSASLARALMAEPSLLLCDEPTGNLDSQNTASILELFDELRADGLTIVLITHDAEVACHASRTASMIDGYLAENEPVVGAAGHDDRNDGGGAVRAACGVPRRRRRSGLRVTCPARTAPRLTVLGTVLGIAALVATLGVSKTAGNQIVGKFNALVATDIVVAPLSERHNPKFLRPHMGRARPAPTSQRCGRRRHSVRRRRAWRPGEQRADQRSARSDVVPAARQGGITRAIPRCGRRCGPAACRMAGTPTVRTGSQCSVGWPRTASTSHASTSSPPSSSVTTCTLCWVCSTTSRVSPTFSMP